MKRKIVNYYIEIEAENDAQIECKQLGIEFGLRSIGCACYDATKYDALTREGNSGNFPTIESIEAYLELK